MSVDFSEDLSRSEISLELFAKLISALQNQNPASDDDSIIDWEAVSPLVDVHNVTITIGAADVEKTETLESVTPLHYFRRSAKDPAGFDLVLTKFGNLSFPNPMDEQLKLGAGMKTDGTGYLVINHSTKFNVANALVLTMWLKLPATAPGDGIQTIIDKEDFAIEIDAHATAANRLRGRVTIGAANKEGTFVYTPDQWFGLILYHDGTNLTLYVDNVQQAQTAAAGAIDTNLTNLGILAKADGTQKCKNGTMISQIGAYDRTIDASWRTDWFVNFVLDLAGSPLAEIFTIPCVVNEKIVTDFTPGLMMFN